MATTRKLPDLVNDSKLLVELHETHAHYFNICNNNSAGPVRRRTWKKETWTRTKRLGGGATGEVWLEKCHTGDKAGQLQAVKVISKGSDFDIYQELETIAKFSQSTSKYEGLFVKSLGWYESDISVFLVMEYFENGSLASHLTHALSENKAKQITAQILEGLACFHENEFVHRDLKPDNILVAAKDPEWWVKIGDFGFSKRTGDNSLHSFVGTQKYFAPEVLGLLPWVDTNTEARERYHCTYAMDMWSLGVTAFYMLCHDYPFQGKELLEYLKGSSFPVTRLSQHHISQEGCAFIEALLSVDPEERLSAAAALEHTWLKEYHVDEPSRASEKLPSTIWNRPAALPSGTDASLSWPVDSTWAPQPAYKDPGLISTGARSEPERLHTKGSREKALDELKALHERGLQLIADKEHTRAEDLFKQAADGRKTILGPYHKESLKSMQQLGVAYLLQRRSQDAQRTLQFTVDLQTELIGSTHIDTLASNYWLSSSLLAQGKLDAAHEIIEQVMETQRMILGLQSEDTIKSLHLGGQIYYEQEKYDNALVLFEQATDAALGINQAVAHETLRSLASCLYKQQRYKESQSILEQIIQASLLVPDVQLLDLLFDIGQSFYEAQSYPDAQLCFEKVSGYCKELLGPEHEQTIKSTLRVASSLCKQRDKVTQAPGVLQRILGMPLPQSTRQSVLDQLHNIGIILWQQRAYTEACAAFQKVLEGRKALLGRQHQDALSSASWLGRSLLYLGRHPEATELLKSVSRDQLKALGSGHLDTAYTNLWLGQSLHYQGQNKTAHSYIQTTYLILLHTLGKEHKESLTCLRCLGSSYCQLKDYSSAEGTLRRALPKAQEVFGPTHEETIRTQVSLGVALYGRRSYQEALEYFCQAADVQIPTLGITAEDTIETLYCIGATLDAQKQYQESERFWRMAADGRRKLLGASHLKTQDAMRSLAFSLAYQGKLKEAVTLQEEVLELRQGTLGPSDAATIESAKDVEKCKKGPEGLGSKWAIFGSERSRQLEYCHL